MKGRKPWEAAAQEALEEAGLIGQVSLSGQAERLARLAS
jgi:hypothetical protein